MGGTSPTTRSGAAERTSKRCSATPTRRRTWVRSLPWPSSTRCSTWWRTTSHSSAERLLPAIPEPLPGLGPRLGAWGDDDRLLRHHPVLLRRPGRTDPTRAGLEPRADLRRLLDLGPDDRPPGPAHRAARGQARGARLDVHRLGPRWRRAHRDLAGARAMAVLRAVVGRDRTLH